MEEKIKDILQKEQLLDIIESNIPVFKKVIGNCLYPKDEKLLIVTDYGKEGRRCAIALAYGYLRASKELNIGSNIIIQNMKIRGEDAEENIVKRLEKHQENNIIILVMSYRLGKIGDLGKSFRSFARKKQHRYITTPSMGSVKNKDIDKIISAIDIDYLELKNKAEKLKQILDKTKKVRITTEKGTDLSIDIEDSIAIKNTGDYTLPGSGGNIPAGEVYIPPKGKENVEGKAIIDISTATRKGTVMIKNPIELKIEKGRIVEITGKEESEKIKESISWAKENSKHPEDVDRICELGIGLNPKAQVIGATIIDEKVKDSIHIAIGSNYWFGGSIYGRIHFDMVISDPKIELDSEELDLKNL